MGQAVSEGLVSQSASQKVIQAAAYSPFIMQGMTGPDPRTVRSPSVVGVLFIIDDSSSMSRHQKRVIDKGNQMLAKMRRANERESIVINIMAIRSVPAQISNGWQRISNPNLPPTDPRNVGCVEDFDNTKITTSSATALRDTLYQGLGASIAYMTGFATSGQLKKLIVAVLTDGQDVSSRHHSEADVADLMSQLQATEKVFPLFFGFGPESDFKGPAQRMGFPDANIIVESQIDDKTLGDKFLFVSEAAMSASRGAVIVPPTQSAAQTPAAGNSGFVSP